MLAHTHMRRIHGHTWLINGIFEAIKVSCKHMKANQLVSEVYYQGFNTDLEGALSVAQSLMQIHSNLSRSVRRCAKLTCHHN